MDNIYFSDILSDVLGTDCKKINDVNIPNSDDDMMSSVSVEDTKQNNIEDSEDIEADDVVEEETSHEETKPSGFKFKKNNNKNRINTTSIFDNTNFFNGGACSEEVVSNAALAISPIVEDQYDYSVAEDIVLLQDRKETTQIIYDIYIHAPFAKSYQDETTGIVKIPKEDIPKVFYYVKDKLLKRKKVSAFETVIAINEFFEFNYDYIIKKVVSSKMMSEILEDYYQNMGMKERIDEMSANPLF